MTTILNLGCGTRTSPLVVNVDWSPYQRLRASRAGRLAAALALRGDRRTRFIAMSGDVVVHDLRKGIPAETDSVDAVYHSHTLEHIDRSVVPAFMAEIRRVLKPGGIHRIAVPDLEHLVRAYLKDLDNQSDCHDRAIEPFLEQAVRRGAHGTSHQPPIRRAVENVVLGDARRRGETHQWMYDWLSLAQLLRNSGFTNIQRVDEHVSAIPRWTEIGLDILPNGEPYKPHSLWMEASKPCPVVTVPGEHRAGSVASRAPR